MTMTIMDFSKTNYQPVGKCIYCGSTDNLEREHILPFGLSGVAVLPASSCRSCAQITGSVEAKLLRGPMWPVRVYLDLMSRTKHKDAAKLYPLKIRKDGKERTVSLSIDEYPILLMFPLFTPPAYFSPEGYKSGIRLEGLVTIAFGKSPDRVAADLGAEGIQIIQSYAPAEFARMIAKVAYSYAAAEGLIISIKGEGFPLSAILGKTDDIGRWVGLLSTELKVQSDLIHRFAMRKQSGLLIGEVQLFASSPTPSYSVILGELE